MRLTFEKPVVVISRCIEHDPCRWNGLMISSDIVRRLKSHVDFRPVCPEVEIGLGVPRKPIRVVRSGGLDRLLQPVTGLDVTDAMKDFADRFLGEAGDADGFILKDRSPSCGNKDVKIYPSAEKASPVKGDGSGFFGGAVAARFPHLAVENEGRLTNLAIREHFLARLFTLSSFKALKKRPDMGSLVRFHSEQKLLLMAYNQAVMREMGKAVANHEKRPTGEVFGRYGDLLGRALSRMPRHVSNINVLMHALGYFSGRITGREKKHFLDSLEQYRSRKVPLGVPSAIVGSWIARFEEKYLASQTFFFPCPEGLVEMSDSGKGR